MDLNVRKLRDSMKSVLGAEIPFIVRSTETHFNVFIDEESVFIGLGKLNELSKLLPGHEIGVGTIPRKVPEGMIDNLVVQVGRKQTQPW